MSVQNKNSSKTGGQSYEVHGFYAFSFGKVRREETSGGALKVNVPTYAIISSEVRDVK